MMAAVRTSRLVMSLTWVSIQVLTSRSFTIEGARMPLVTGSTWSRAVAL